MPTKTSAGPKRGGASWGSASGPSLDIEHMQHIAHGVPMSLTTHYALTARLKAERRAGAGSGFRVGDRRSCHRLPLAGADIIRTHKKKTSQYFGFLPV
jgi:hypothetical protein